jgi:hypothetical protein
MSQKLGFQPVSGLTGNTLKIMGVVALPASQSQGRSGSDCQTERELQAIDKSMIKVEAACDLGNRIKRALVRRRVRAE